MSYTSILSEMIQWFNREKNKFSPFNFKKKQSFSTLLPFASNAFAQ